MSNGGIEFQPLTLETWPDLVKLFEGHGNPGYCWCTYWRLSSTQYSQSSSLERKKALNQIVAEGTPTGLLGYRDGEVIGWCSIAPRASHARLNRSRSIPQLEGGNVWSIVCFYLDRRVQNQGLSYKFLRAAVEHAAGQGADAVEGYPVEPEYDENGNWNPATSYALWGIDQHSNGRVFEM